MFKKFRSTVTDIFTTTSGKETKILSAMNHDDSSIINHMLRRKQIDVNHKIKGVVSLRDYAIRNTCPNVLKVLIDHGVDLLICRRIDLGKNCLHDAVANISKREIPTNSNDYQKATTIVDMLVGGLERLSNDTVLEKVFIERNCDSMTSFLLACQSFYDEIIMKFLTLITADTRRKICKSYLIDESGQNPFHFAYGMQVKSVEALIDRLPFVESLVNTKKSIDGMTSLHMLACSEIPSQNSSGIAKLLITSAFADPDLVDDEGATALHYAISCKDDGLVDTLLRAGCRTDVINNEGNSPLALALYRHFDDFLSEEDVTAAVRILELLLAFQVDLQKELYLYSETERPDLFIDSSVADRCSGFIHPKFLETFRQLRQANQIPSLKRICRNAIRNSLKPQADDLIRNLTSIPMHLKSYLLVENEPPVLKETCDAILKATVGD